MTGQEIIDLALLHYGDSGSTYVSETDATKYLNEALLEIYEDLPINRIRNLMGTETLTIASGTIPVDSDWDKVVEIYISDIPALQVTYDVIAAEDYGESGYFVTGLPVFHVDQRNIHVRPKGDPATIIFLTAPEPITNLALAVTDIDALWHPVMANLMASYMYAQEEDPQQAQHYKTLYQQKLTSLNASSGQGE